VTKEKSFITSTPGVGAVPAKMLNSAAIVLKLFLLFTIFPG
jgi:hypothetical protein